MTEIVRTSSLPLSISRSLYISPSNGVIAPMA